MTDTAATDGPGPDLEPSRPPAVAAWWATSTRVDKLAPAWVAALGELDEVARTRTADAGTYSYRYADLGAVLGTSRTVLAAHGLALFQVSTIDGRDVEISTTVMHTSAQWITFAPMRLPAGNTAQSAGSAMTYARRYSALAVLGLATDDDDGATATGTRDTTPATISPDNVARFLERATELGIDDVGPVVETATGGRTTDPTAVHRSELQALRDALAATGQRAPSPVTASSDQLRRLDSLDRRLELGLDRLDVIAAVVGRKVESTIELSRHEADTLIVVYTGLLLGTHAIAYDDTGAATITTTTATTDGPVQAHTGASPTSDGPGTP